MGPTVGWNSLLIELFWPKLCSNGSRKGWIRLWSAWLNWHFGTETDLFNFQYMRRASPISRASPLNRDGSNYRSVYIIGVVWWWHRYSRVNTPSQFCSSQKCYCLFLSLGWPLIMLALITISVHSWKTMRYGQEILKLFSCSKTNNWIWTQNLLGSGSLSSKLQRDSWGAEQGHLLIFFFLETFLHTVTTISVEPGSFCRYRGTDYVQQKKQCNQTIKPPGELYCLVPLVLLWWQYLQKDLTVATILSRFLNILSSKISFGTPPSSEEGPLHCPPLETRKAMRRGCIRWL